MKKSLFLSEGRFYKANLHMHTVISDGKFTPEEAKAYYQAHGYEVVAFSDHEIMVPHPELQDDTFLPLTAIECEFKQIAYPFRNAKEADEAGIPKFLSRGQVYHLIYIAPRLEETYYPWPTRSYVWGNAKEYIQDYYVGENPRTFSFETANAATKDAHDHGFLVEYCHPFWSGNRYDTYDHLENIDFVETYNTDCVASGYLLDASDRPFDDFLHLSKHVSPVCNDDCHSVKSACGAATYIKAGALTYDKIFGSLAHGDCFASYGPLFKEIAYDPETKVLSVETTPVRQIALTTGIRYAKVSGNFREGTVTEAEFDLTDYVDAIAKYGEPSRQFLRLTLVDEERRKAYSRGYFLSELMEI